MHIRWRDIDREQHVSVLAAKREEKREERSHELTGAEGRLNPIHGNISALDPIKSKPQSSLQERQKLKGNAREEGRSGWWWRREERESKSKRIENHIILSWISSRCVRHLIPRLSFPACNCIVSSQSRRVVFPSQGICYLWYQRKE